MTYLPQLAAAVMAVGAISGGALTLDKMHVASSDFEQYVEAQASSEQSRYVLQLKKEIRELRQILSRDPSDQYLQNALADLVDELCLMQPDDRECG